MSCFFSRPNHLTFLKTQASELTPEYTTVPQYNDVPKTHLNSGSASVYSPDHIASIFGDRSPQCNLKRFGAQTREWYRYVQHPAKLWKFQSVIFYVADDSAKLYVNGRQWPETTNWEHFQVRSLQVKHGDVVALEVADSLGGGLVRGDRCTLCRITTSCT